MLGGIKAAARVPAERFMIFPVLRPNERKYHAAVERVPFDGAIYRPLVPLNQNFTWLKEKLTVSLNRASSSYRATTAAPPPAPAPAPRATRVVERQPAVPAPIRAEPRRSTREVRPSTLREAAVGMADDDDSAMDDSDSEEGGLDLTDIVDHQLQDGDCWLKVLTSDGEASWIPLLGLLADQDLAAALRQYAAASDDATFQAAVSESIARIGAEERQED